MQEEGPFLSSSPTHLCVFAQGRVGSAVLSVLKLVDWAQTFLTVEFVGALPTSSLAPLSCVGLGIGSALLPRVSWLAARLWLQQLGLQCLTACESVVSRLPSLSLLPDTSRARAPEGPAGGRVLPHPPVCPQA